MPAVTVDDLTVLPRVAAPAAGDAPRPVVSVTTAPTGFEGEGFPVRRAFAGVDLRDLDPFIHMDQMGEVEYAPGEPKGTPWHPHRGFETVTYIIDGIFDHQDSLRWRRHDHRRRHPVDDRRVRDPAHRGAAGAAGRLSGGLFHGIQLWVNLPRGRQVGAPRYQDLRAGEVGLLTSADGGALLRVIAGEVAGHAGPGVDAHPDDDGARDRRRPVRELDAAVAARLQRPRLRAGRPRHRRPRPDARSRTGQLAVLGAGDPSRLSAAQARRRATPRGWTSSSSAVCRSASRSRGPARS